MSSEPSSTSARQCSPADWPGLRRIRFTSNGILRLFFFIIPLAHRTEPSLASELSTSDIDMVYGFVTALTAKYNCARMIISLSEFLPSPAVHSEAPASPLREILYQKFNTVKLPCQIKRGFARKCKRADKCRRVQELRTKTRPMEGEARDEGASAELSDM